MPAVNLNRIYMLRARERRPILNGVNVPDAAGAYQRATMPALRARLAISENEARLKQDDIHRKYQGIATGIRALQGTINGIADIQNAMERARDRQRATALRDLFNDCERNMLEARKKFAEAERARFANPDGTYTTQGPLVEAIDSLKAWRESKNDAYAALDDEGKKQFDARFEMKRLEIEAEAAEKQAEQQQKQAAQSIKDDADIQEQKIHTLFDPENAGKFAGVLPEYMQAKEFAFKFARRQIDAAGAELRPETDEDRAAWDVEQRRICDAVQLERLQHLANRYIETGDSTCLNELKAWGGEKVEGECVLPPDDVTALQDDAKRQKVREMASDAQEKWTAREERRMAEEDKAAMEGAKIGVLDALKAAGDAPLDTARISALRETPFHDKSKSEALNAWIDSNIADANDARIIRQLGEKLGLQEAPAEGPFAQEREAAKNIQDPKKREAAIAVIDSVEAGREFESWDADYERAVEQLEQLEGFSEGTIRIQQEAIANVLEAIGDLRTEAAREMAMKRVAGVQGELGKFYSQMAIDVLNQGWYLGRDGKPHSLSDREAIDIYSRFIPYMTREQKDAVHAAYAKQRVQLAPQDFTGLEDWLAQKGIPLQNLYSWTDMARTGKVEVNSELFSHAIPDMEGFADDYTQNEGLAREIWAAVEQFKLMQTTLQGKDSAGKAMTLRQYLDGYFDQNRNLLDAWNDSRTARRVAETRRIFDQLEAEMFYGPFSEPERPIEEDE